MRTHQLWLKQIMKLGFLLMMGVSMSADAGLFGFGGKSWKEEVLLHDGSKVVVERSFSRGGRHEIGQGAPIKEQEIAFTLSGTNRTVTWKSEYGDDIGRSNFNLLALHILNGTPYIVASPNLCLSYNKWGRPNPPYVLYKFDGKAWQRIPLAELPAEFKDVNVVIVIDNADLFRAIEKHEVVSAATVKELNGVLRQPEYKTVLRDVVKTGSSSTVNCEELVYYKGAWVGPGDSIGKRMMDSKAK